MDERMKKTFEKRYKNEVIQKGDIVLVRLETVCGEKGAPKTVNCRGENY